jgi:hypothetical protein
MRQVLGGSSESQASKSVHQRHAPVSRQEMLRTKRSQRYLDALRGLDAGGALADPAALAALHEAITAEFPEAELAPLGWVAKCYLGMPYEVHTLDATGAITRHYRWGEPLPPALERARSLARSGRYLVIEVHADRLIAIADDGATSVCTT